MYMDVSAKTGQNVDELFSVVAKIALKYAPLKRFPQFSIHLHQY